MKLEQAARQALNWIDANAPRYVFEAIEEALAGVNMSPTEQAEQEPVAEVHNTDTPSNWSIIKPGLPAGTKLYAAPVRTKDLTDDEIEAIVNSVGAYEVGYWQHAFARAVIAADREKNK